MTDEKPLEHPDVTERTYVSKDFNFKFVLLKQLNRVSYFMSVGEWTNANMSLNTLSALLYVQGKKVKGFQEKYDSLESEILDSIRIEYSDIRSQVVGHLSNYNPTRSQQEEIDWKCKAKYATVMSEFCAKKLKMLMIVMDRSNLLLEESAEAEEE